MANWHVHAEKAGACNSGWSEDCPASSCLLAYDWITRCIRGDCGIGGAWRALNHGFSELLYLFASTQQLEHRISQSWKGLEELQRQSGTDVLVKDVDSLPGDLKERLLASLVPDKAKITLISANGNRVGLYGTQRDPHVWATATDAQDLETFEVCRLGNGRIALRSLAANGMFLTASPCTGCTLASSNTKECAHFSVYPLGGDRVALRAHHGHFMRAVGGGGGVVQCDAERIGACEVLQVELVGSLEPSEMQSDTWWSDRVRMCAHVHDLHC